MSALAQGPAAVALGSLLPPPARLIAPWALPLGMVLLCRGRIRLTIDDRPIGRARRLFEECFYAYWSGSLVALLLFLAGLPLAALGWVPVSVVAAATLALGVLVGIYGTLISPRRPRLRELELALDGLAAELDGLRIAHWSDLHIGSVTPPERIDGWRARTARLAPDLLVLTGDFATTGTRFHGVIAERLGLLRAPHGVFAVLGNHDNFGEDLPLARALREAGIALLMNERRELTVRGVAVDVVGVDDHYTGRADPSRAMDARRPGAFCLALVHNPKAFPDLADRGADLVLAGHTHWGQLAVPGFPRKNLAATLFRYSAGLYRRSSAALWVHPGLGATGLPLRLGARPEITLIVLRASARGQTVS